MSDYCDIVRHLEQLADASVAAQQSRYFKTGKGEYGEGDIFAGIRVPDLRKLARQYKQISFPVIDKLLHSKIHEYRLLALILMIALYGKSTEAQQKQIYQYYLDNRAYINNWDLVDISAKNIIGHYLFKRKRKPLFMLLKSKSLWDRRIAVLSTFYFINQNDFADSLLMAKGLLSDKEDLMHKAVGWMLREIGKRDRDVEEQFLLQHYQSMPRTMLRYAIEKFPQKRRLQYLHARL